MPTSLALTFLGKARKYSSIRALRERIRRSPRRSEARSIQLLKDWLSTDQLAQFNATGCFEVLGCDTGKRYRINYGKSANIDELDDRNQPRSSYCLVTEVPLALGDVMLAQKIALETYELAALAVANKWNVH